MTTQHECSICQVPTDEDDLCEQLTCRKCHISISFEDCVAASKASMQRIMEIAQRDRARAMERTKRDIVATARLTAAELMPGTFSCGNCLMLAWCVISEAKKHGIKLKLYAGSCHWPATDDGLFGFEWSPYSAVSKAAIAAGFLPEIHVWAGNPETKEIVDLATADLPAFFERGLGVKWTAPKPPPYLWNAKLPPGVTYTAYVDAGNFVYGKLLKLIRSVKDKESNT